MGFERSCCFLFFFLTVGLASSSPSTHISYDALRVQRGRGLVEKFYVKNVCPVDFGKEDMTPLTSKCRGPHYNPLTCCTGFKQITCKYLPLINKLANGCATGLFYHVNRRGGYPDGLFDQICHDDPQGLSCTTVLGRSNGNKGRN
ncbi:GPI-anchored protein LLG1 [Capsicum chacoense]